jgi:hypothetical protein
MPAVGVAASLRAIETPTGDDSLGYSTGPDFGCIREIRKGDNESICRIEASQRIDGGAIHPGLIDSLRQTVLPACEGYAAEIGQK